MINPKLKDALMDWHKWECELSVSHAELEAHLYGHANTQRIAALEEIRKIVENGEFNDPGLLVIPGQTVHIPATDGCTIWTG